MVGCCSATVAASPSPIRSSRPHTPLHSVHRRARTPQTHRGTFFLQAAGAQCRCSCTAKPSPLQSPLSSSALHARTASLSGASVTVLEFERRCRRKVGPTKITAKFELKPPPYPLNALEPIMSQETLEYHWGKHHRTYVENLNKQIVGTDLDGMSLEEVVVTSYNKGDILPAFNNAAQAWNHDFFWESMKPGGGGKPSGDLLRLIERDFGSFVRFLDEFKTAAQTQFGSGWAWFAYKDSRLDIGNTENPLRTDQDKKLVVVKSPNGVNPLVWGYYYPLLTIDVWEHAYYLDFQNRRTDYISVFMDKLVSWEAINSRFDQAKAVIAEMEREDERKLREEEERFLTSDEPAEIYPDSDAELDAE